MRRKAVNVAFRLRGNKEPKTSERLAYKHDYEEHKSPILGGGDAEVKAFGVYVCVFLCVHYTQKLSFLHCV